MKTILSSIAVIGLLLSGGTASAEPISVKFSLGACPIGHPMVKAAESFSKYIFEKSGGKYNATVLPAGTIGNFDTVFQGVQMGSIHIAVETVSNLSTFYPEIAGLDLPYLFKDNETAKKYLAGDLFKAQMKEMEKKRPAINIIGACSAGFRFMCSKPEWKTLADLQGKKDRVSGNRLHVAAIKALGMNPTPTAAAEILSSLQQGVVDSVDAEIFWPPTARIYDVAKYYLKMDAMPVFYVTTASAPWLKKLPETDRAMFVEALDWYVGESNKIIAEEMKSVIAFLKQQGCVIHEFSEADKAEAAKKTADMVNDLRAPQKAFYEKVKNSL